MIHLFRGAFRFCKLNTSTVATQAIPIHLRPYDPKKYEVPSSKLKIATGYAFLDVEPVPRAKIMKLCYIILDKLDKEIPEGVIYRVYTEEKLKYIMRLVDQIEDIRQLEEEFNNEPIELFIQSLTKEIELVERMKFLKPWEMKDDEESYEALRETAIPQKHLKHDQPTREQAKFIE